MPLLSASLRSTNREQHRSSTEPSTVFLLPLLYVASQNIITNQHRRGSSLSVLSKNVRKEQSFFLCTCSKIEPWLSAWVLTTDICCHCCLIISSSSNDHNRKRPLIVFDGSSSHSGPIKVKKPEGTTVPTGVTDRLKPPPVANLSNPIRKLSANTSSTSSPNHRSNDTDTNLKRGANSSVGTLIYVSSVTHKFTVWFKEDEHNYQLCSVFLVFNLVFNCFN